MSADMTFKRACRIFGEGNEGLGRERMFTLAAVLDLARKKHPQFAKDARDGCVVCGNEWAELAQAVRHETPYRQYCEALDVAVTALRLAFEEDDHNAHRCQSTRLHSSHQNNVRRIVDVA